MPDFLSDIFISYAHNDNDGSNWVSAFVRQLGYAVTRRLGRAPRLFFDDGRLTGNESEGVFEREAAHARLFVPILSPSFVAKDWPRKELASFLAQAPGALERVYPVELLPVTDQSIPLALQQKIRKHKFWQTIPEAGSDIEIQLDPTADLRAFTLRIEELSARLSRHLQLMAQTGDGALSATPRPEAGPAAAAVAPAPAPAPEPAAPPVPAVLLGQTTIDLEDEALRLRRYLEQFGFRVLPDDTLPQGGEDFTRSFAEQAAQSVLFVQLLGPHADRRPKDLPAGYTAHQVAAAQAAGLPSMLWCRPDLPADLREGHRDAALFASADLMACGIEEFKSAVVARMQALTRPPPAAQRAAAADHIFIDSDRVDIDLARSIADELQRRSAAVFLPVFDGPPEDIARDLKDSLTDCTGIVIVFGAAPPTWVRARLRFAGRVGYENPGAARKIIAVYLHPPRQQDDLGVLSPNIVWVDGRGAGRGEALTRALIGAAS